MTKKLIGILVCILFFGATVFPSIAGYEKVINKNEINDYNNPIKYAIECGVLSNKYWLEQDKLLASDGGGDDQFSWCVSIDGDYALIGACDDYNDNGSAYVFKRNGTTWTEEQKLVPSDSAEGDHFGWSVSIDGDYALIGAYSNDKRGGRGAAYVFKRNGTTWTEEQRLRASDGVNYDFFGLAVCIKGDYAFIGAPYEGDENQGSVYVFKRNGTTWTEEQKLVASDGPTWEYFGRSISIDGDYAIITAHDDENTKGSAYVFKRNGTTWTETQKLVASDRMYIGWVVSIDGDYALIGSPKEDNKRGAAYVFKRNGTTWTEEQKLLASDGAKNDLFGRTVSIDGDYALIGAPIDDSWTGSVYVFKRNGTTWTEEQKLYASDSEKGDDFGWSVSIDGDYALIGALYSENDKGAAYVFTRGENQRPNADAGGPYYGIAGESISFTGSGSYDPDGYIVNWTWYFGDGTYGYGETTNHSFQWGGEYTIILTVTDHLGGTDYDLTIADVNSPPDAPIINGPIEGKPGVSYLYKFKSTDPDGDDVFYYIDWGDGIIEDWFGPFGSGEEVEKTHVFNNTGTYIIYAKAWDIRGSESDWGTFTVTIPRDKVFNRPILLFLQNHPNMFPLLQKILQHFGL